MRGNANSRHLPVKVTAVPTKARRLPVKVTHTVVPLVVPAAPLPRRKSATIDYAEVVREAKSILAQDRVEPGASHR
jgi:hypothetical protein